MPPEFKNIQEPTNSPNPVAAHTPAKLRQAFALHQKGQLGQAQALYEEILKAQPDHYGALHLLGVIASQTRNYRAAVRLIDEAIRLQPTIAAFYSNRCNALLELAQYEAALASAEKAIALQPDLPEAYTNRGSVLHKLQQYDAAVASYNIAITLRPDLTVAHYNRGNALHKLKQYDAAIASYDIAITLQTNYADAHCNRGVALHELQQYDAAVASYDIAIALKTNYADAYFNRANTLLQLLRLDAAVTSYDTAIALDPDFAEAYWNKSHALLLGGDLIRGWELYEWRWASKVSRLLGWFTERDFPQPLWLGKEPLAGKTILLHGEQGLGDMIQFCRYATLVSDLGARVILDVPTPLAGLLNTLSGVSDLTVTGGPLPAFDYHCPLMSLPLAFKTTLDSIPCATKYLSADPVKLLHWASKFGEKSTPRIGLVWSGRPDHKNDRDRSITLAAFIQDLPTGCQYVSLQNDVRDIDKPTLESRTDILHFGDNLHDFTDTAALCALVDVVITVDTSVAHLSGALGRPTWVLLPFSPDWRWLLDRDDSPWYPSMRLFRQQHPGDWNGVLDRVAIELEKLTVSHGQKCKDRNDCY